MTTLNLIKKERQYVGDFLKNYYEPLTNSIKYGSVYDNTQIIFIKILQIAVVVFILFGCFLPRHLLLWHCFVCFIALTMIDTNMTILNEIIKNIMIRQNPKLSIDELDRVSESTPFTKKTCKIVLFISFVISLISYLYPEYALNVFLKKVFCKMEHINEEDIEKTAQQNINTEWKTNKPQKIIHNMITVDNITDHISDKKTISETEKIALELENPDLGLSIFDKKKYTNKININPVYQIKAPPTNKITINNDQFDAHKNEIIDIYKFDNKKQNIDALKEKLKESLLKFDF